MNWIMYSIITALLWGICYTSAEQVIKVIDKSTYISMSCLLSLCVFAFVCKTHIAHDIIEIQNNPKVIYWIVAAIMSSVIGTYMSFLAIETSNASLAASLEITYPFWCILFGWLLFGTTMSLVSIIGVVVVFVGVSIIIYGK